MEWYSIGRSCGATFDQDIFIVAINCRLIQWYICNTFYKIKPPNLYGVVRLERVVVVQKIISIKNYCPWESIPHITR